MGAPAIPAPCARHMKVLLTGANGFVGSHVLDALRVRAIPTIALLRAGSNNRFIQTHLGQIETRTGSIEDATGLEEAVREVTHVIHCAGATKALRPADFTRVNHLGTRHLVDVINRHLDRLERFVHLSSLASVGPAGPSRPAAEADPANPVSEYGRSKLAGERAVAEHCRAPYVILRPPAVYGPRDREFLRLFKSARRHLGLRLLGGPQALSMVYVGDLADAVLETLTRAEAVGRTYHVASPEVVTPRQVTDEVAAQSGSWTVPLPLPVISLWPLCLGQDWLSQLTGRPSVLGRQKFAELRAPGWVCSAQRLREELGFVCGTNLRAGVAKTLAWYRQERWL
jgi:nucleoside-diphosphate-sugar epimerase